MSISVVFVLSPILGTKVYIPLLCFGCCTCSEINSAFRLANLRTLSFLVSLHSDEQQHFLSETYFLSGLLQSSQCGGVYVTVTHFQVEI